MFFISGLLPPFLNVVELLSLDAKGVKWPKRSPLGNVLWGYPLLLIKKKKLRKCWICLINAFTNNSEK